MLKPAILYKEEIEKEFAERMYTDEFFLYSGFGHHGSPIEISPDDYAREYAIVDSKGRLIGYMSYRIDPEAECAKDFGLYSFEPGNPTVGKDVFEEMERLIKRYHKVEWRMISGNPAQRSYDKFCEKNGGRMLILRDVCKDHYGKYRDCIIYEIVEGDGNED